MFCPSIHSRTVKTYFALSNFAEQYIGLCLMSRICLHTLHFSRVSIGGDLVQVFGGTGSAR